MPLWVTCIIKVVEIGFLHFCFLFVNVGILEYTTRTCKHCKRCLLKINHNSNVINGLILEAIFNIMLCTLCNYKQQLFLIDYKICGCSWRLRWSTADFCVVLLFGYCDHTKISSQYTQSFVFICIFMWFANWSMHILVNILSFNIFFVLVG